MSREGRMHAARVAVALLTFGLSITPSASAPIELPLSLEDPGSGEKVSIEAGAPVLHLVLFATWCPPCRDELPRLAELEARWGGQGYRLVLIAIRNRQSLPRLTRFVEERKPPGRLLFDAEGRVQARLEQDELPTHLVLDASGTEIVRDGALSQEVEQAVRRLMTARDR